VSDEMYLIPEHGGLVALKSTAYAREADLQALLADHPELLAGGQITPEDPRRWLLINREKGLTDQQDGANRWSVDHLFIDHDGIPTIVEVKRSSNTQIRREIVGQMLDYAANGLRYWPVEHLRSDLVRRLEQSGTPEASAAADELVLQLVGPDFAKSDDAVGEFWQRVDDNLSAGRLRLLFVADLIPPELLSVIEFLNDQMARTEVLGIEVRQFTSGSDRLVTPTVVGRTREAAKTKRQAESVPLEDLIENASKETREVGRRLAALGEKYGLVERRRPKSLVYDNPSLDARYFTWYVTYDMVEFYLDVMADTGETESAEALRNALSALTGSVLSSRHPGVSCARLLASWDSFVEAWVPRYVEAVASSSASRRVQGLSPGGASTVT
jgi:hypothetical protein